MQIEEDPAYSLSINQERRDGLPLSPEYGSPRPQLIMTPSLKPLWLKILFFLRIHPVLKPVVENMAQIVLIFLVFITLSSALVFQLLLLIYISGILLVLLTISAIRERKKNRILGTLLLINCIILFLALFGITFVILNR